MQHDLFLAVGGRYGWGLFLCVTLSGYGWWLVALSIRGEARRWARTTSKARGVQTLTGFALQTPLLIYLFLGFATGFPYAP